MPYNVAEFTRQFQPGYDVQRNQQYVADHNKMQNALLQREMVAEQQRREGLVNLANQNAPGVAPVAPPGPRLNALAPAMEQGGPAPGVAPGMTPGVAPGPTPAPINNYGNYMAAQEYTKDFFTQALPLLNLAQSMENNDLKDSIAERAIATGIPALSSFGDLLKRTSLRKGGGSAHVNFTGENDPTSFYNRFKTYFDAMGVGVDDLKGYKGTIEFDGPVNDLRPTKWTQDKMESAAKVEKKEKYSGTVHATKANLAKLKEKIDPGSPLFDTIDALENDIPKRPKNARPAILDVTYFEDGTVKDIKEKFEPPETKINIHTGDGGTTVPFTDDEFERFYNMNQKTEALPRRVQGTARANQKAREQWDVAFAAWLKRTGRTGAGAGIDALSGRGDTRSLDYAIKTRDAMAPFVGNMNAQIARINDLAKKLPSSQAPRILAMPLNEAKRAIMGDAKLAAYRMYITEIEAEAGKLATGSTGSVKELSQTAQEKWAKIHDKNMPLGEMLKLLKETKHMGELRLKEQDKVVTDIKKRMNRAGGTKQVPTLAEWLPLARKANPGVSDADLGRYYDKKYKGK